MAGDAFEKIVVVTRKTALQELVERFGTRAQARFYVDHLGGRFAEYEAAHVAYETALGAVRRALPRGVRSQFIDRAFVPTFLFGDHDLVVVLGPDGLVVNAAKYLSGQPIVAFNPDPGRIDGVLLPFGVGEAPGVLEHVLSGRFGIAAVSMAKAELNDGQTLHAVNDLFIGHRSHVSARYHLRFSGRQESQISSGLIVSTGAGATGWFRSILTGAAAVAQSFGASAAADAYFGQCGLSWSARHLFYSVREPFISRVSSAELVFGRIDAGQCLEVESQMPQGGVIFSDGIEIDRIEFNSGSLARIGLAERHVELVMQVGK